MADIQADWDSAEPVQPDLKADWDSAEPVQKAAKAPPQKAEEATSTGKPMGLLEAGKSALDAAAGAADIVAGGVINTLAPPFAAAESLIRGQPYDQVRKKWQYTPSAGSAREGMQVLDQTVGRVAKPIAHGIGAGLDFVTGGNVTPGAQEDLGNTALALTGLAGRAATGVGRAATALTRRRIAGRIVESDTGKAYMPPVQEALENAQPLVPGHQPDAASVMAQQNPVLDAKGNVIDVQGLPEGSPLQAIQEGVSEAKGGPSAEAGKRWQQNEAALKAAEKDRDEVTAPIRERALSTVQRNTEASVSNQKALQDAQATLEASEAARVEALQKHGQVQTMQAQADANAARTGPRTDSVIGESRLNRTQNFDNGNPPVNGLPRPGLSMPLRMNREAMSGEMGDYAAESAENVLRRTQEVRVARQELADAQKAAANTPAGLDVTTVRDKAVSLLRDARGNPHIPKVLSPLLDELNTIGNDPVALYNVRKSINELLERRVTDSDYALVQAAGKQLRSLRSSIDDAFEAAGGESWKKYINEYAGRSRTIDTLRLIQDKRYSPSQRTSLGSPDSQAQGQVPRGAHIYSRPMALLNWGRQILTGKVLGPRTIKQLSEWTLNPTQMAADLKAMSPGQRVLMNQAIKKWTQPVGAASAATDQQQ